MQVNKEEGEKKDNLKYITLSLFLVLWMFCTGLFFVWVVDLLGWDLVGTPIGGFYVGQLMLLFVAICAVIVFIPLGIICYLTIRLVDYLEIRLKKH